MLGALWLIVSVKGLELAYLYSLTTEPPGIHAPATGYLEDPCLQRLEENVPQYMASLPTPTGAAGSAWHNLSTQATWSLTNEMEMAAG